MPAWGPTARNGMSDHRHGSLVCIDHTEILVPVINIYIYIYNLYLCERAQVLHVLLSPGSREGARSGRAGAARGGKAGLSSLA